MAQPLPLLSVLLTPEPVYTLTCGGVKLSGLRELSRWEGFRKLGNELGSVIVADPEHPFSRTLDEAFDRAPEHFRVLAASPEILARLTQSSAATVEGATP